MVNPWLFLCIVPILFENNRCDVIKKAEKRGTTQLV
jgi:hypothetical protein